MPQEQIPLPPPNISQLNCAWCGDKAVELLEIERSRWRYIYNEVEQRSIKVLAKRAITAPACMKHRDILIRNNPKLDEEYKGSRKQKGKTGKGRTGKGWVVRS